MRARFGERWPALAFLAVAAVLGVIGFLVGDERVRALLWILAIPIGLSGLAVLAWGNAAGEIDRLMKDRR